MVFLTEDPAFPYVLMTAFLLLWFTAILNGLILAVGGLNVSYLKIRGVTECKKYRHRIEVAVRLKKHHTWMLVSLTLLSVAASQAFTLIMANIWQGHLLSSYVVLSTACLLFFGGIIPQTIMSKHAVAWAYYCRHWIWFCMIITFPISWPLAWALEQCQRSDEFMPGGYKEFNGTFDDLELSRLIEYHGQSEKNGGTLDHEAVCDMVLALRDNVQRRVNAENSHGGYPGHRNVEEEAIRVMLGRLPASSQRHACVNASGAGMDGAGDDSERSPYQSCVRLEAESNSKKRSRVLSLSSYTENSHGGFHGNRSSTV